MERCLIRKGYVTSLPPGPGCGIQLPYPDCLLLNSIVLPRGGQEAIYSPENFAMLIELLPPNFHFLSKMKMKRVSKQVLKSEFFPAKRSFILGRLSGGYYGFSSPTS